MGSFVPKESTVSWADDLESEINRMEIPSVSPQTTKLSEKECPPISNRITESEPKARVENQAKQVF